MNILCFIDGLGSGGAQRQIVNLAIGLKSRDYNVEMISYTDADFFLNRLKGAGIKYSVISNNNNVERIIRVRKYIHQAQPDIVISFLETPNFIACLSSIGKHKWSLITSERNAKVYEFTNKRGKLMKWFERFSDWTVCNSNVAKQLWCKYYPQYQERISTIYNPVVIPEISAPKNGNKDKLRIVIAASYQRLKNPIGLVEAVHILEDQYKDKIHIDWYGKNVGPENDGVYEQAYTLRKQYQLENCVTLHGETQEIYKEMIDSDAVALFSEVEGLPNTICEGMMCGKPILMSRMSDYKTLVTSENGFLCDADKPESIAEAIRKFVQLTEEQREEMGKRSKQMAMDLFDPEKNIDQWERIIKALVDNKTHI